MNMKLRNIPFSPPDMSEAEVQLVAEALRSGWITTGPKTKEFERKVASYCGTSTAVALNSATASMEMTLRVLGVGPGDEVVIPAYTYTATASAVVHVGATVVMVDSQADCIEMDYDKLADAITERTKVVVPVDVAGVVCDYDRVFAVVESKKHLFRPSTELQRAYGRPIVMCDAAHSFGSKWHGKISGSIADFTCFSFHAVKNFTTAEGGAVTWIDRPFIDSEAIYKQYMLYSLHGQSKDALAKTKLGQWEYDIKGPWYKCNMTDITAAIGLAQFQRYDSMLARRHSIIRIYDEALKGMDVTLLNHVGDDHCSNAHLYIVRLNGHDAEVRNDVIVKMAERGVATNVHFKPLPMMTAYKELGFDISNYPNAYSLFSNSITLPLYSRLTEEDAEYVISQFVDIISKL